METEPAYLECGDVIASDRGIIETEAGKQMLLVPRDSIKHITLRYGCASHRPVPELVVGLLLAGVFLFDVGRILISGKASRYDIGFLAFGLIGGYLIYSVAQRYHYLHIKTEAADYKIRFSPDQNLTEIKLFCRQVQKRWNYEMLIELGSTRNL